MKLKNSVTIALLALLFITVSCSKDDDNNSDVKKKFSENTVEDNKQAVEDAGISFVNEMADIKNEPAVEVMTALSYFLEHADPFSSGEMGGMKVEKLRGAYAFIPTFSLSNINEIGYQGVLKSLAVNPLDEEPETIQDVYDVLVGVYSWNIVGEYWDYLKAGDAIVFKFPSTENGTENNVSYTVKYTGYTGALPDIITEDYTGDLPMKVETTLQLDGTDILVFNTAIDYSTEGMPTAVLSSIVLQNVEFIFSATNVDNSTASLSFEIKKDSKVLAKFAVAAEGDWNTSNIENNTHYYQYVTTDGYNYIEKEVTEGDDWELMELDVHKVVQGGNALIQISNIKIEGIVNTEALGNEVIAIEENQELEDSIMIANICTAMNNNINLSLRFVDTDEIIALVEAYPEQKTRIQYEYFNNGEWSETPIVVEETYYDLGLRFVFADNSTIDAAVYFGEGFEDLLSELEGLSENK